MAEKRLLENWLDSFLEWTLPRSEAPESMLRWVGLFTLAALKKRKVWWSRELLGGYEIYPNLYLVLVGSPAVVRKSTTIGFSETLLVDHAKSGDESIAFAGDVTSHSKLLQALSDSPDGAVTVVSSEFSSLIQATPEAMYEILTDIFDNKPKVDWSTWAHGDKSIESPSVNLLAATTPAWISKQPPEYFVGGGFASRILFLYEEEPRQREIFYDHLDKGKLKSLEISLTSDLNLIANVSGEFGFDTKETKEYIRGWYKDQDSYSSDSRLQGYYGRKHVHALKTATLLSLSERSDRKITKAHFDKSIEMLNYIERKMSRAFSTLGQNPFAILMEDILEYVEANGSRTLTDIAGRFYQQGMTLDQLKSALAFLCTGAKLKASGLQNPTYTFIRY
jgi:hypothetical protein